MPKIGTGYISVQADLDPFWRTIEREMAAGGRRSGREFGKGFGGGFDGRAVSRSLDDVGRSTRRASKGFEGLVSSFGGGNDGARRAARALDSFGGASGGATATIGGLRIAVAALVPIFVGFGGAAVAATSSLGPLIGLLAAGGSAAGAAAQGFGVLSLATMGVSEALQEQTDKHLKTAGAAISNAAQQRSAARAIQSAQDGVQDAIRGVTDAEDDLQDAQGDARKAQKGLTVARREAKRALEDLRTSLINTTLGEADAVLGLYDAQKALADLGKSASQEDLAAASWSVTEALHGQHGAVLALVSAQQALNDLLNKGAKTEERRAAMQAALQRAQANLTQVEADANATYDEKTHALQLVADATKAVSDANATETVSELDKAKAVQSVVEAQDAVVDAQANAVATQKALQALQAGPTSRDQAGALLDVLSAQQRLMEAETERQRTTAELAKAERDGIDKSPDVIAAKDAIREADKRVQDAEQALKDSHHDVIRAQQALADAQIAATEATDKQGIAAANLNKKFDALPPAAQAFVRELQSMKPELDHLRQTAAQGFFPGATEGLQAAAKNFGPLERVVAKTAGVLGDLAKRFGELIGSSAFGKDLETIGGRNAKVIDTLGGAALHLVSALRHVLVAVGPLTQHLADLIAGWAKNADEAAKSGRETGKLAGFFEKTRAITERLLSIVGHLGSGLLGLGKVGKRTGDSIWASIDRAAARFDKWANSAKGQKQLHDFFQRAKDLAAALLPVLSGITGAISLLVLKTFPLASILKLLGPYASEATVAFIGYKVATLAVAAATNLATFATKAYALWMGRMSLNAILWRASLLTATVATGVATAAQWALNVAMTANPIGVVIVGIAALVAGFVLLGGKLSWVTDAFAVAWSVIKDGATAVLGWLKTNWPMVLAILGGPIGLIVLAVVKNWDTIKTVTTTVWNAIKSFLGGIWNAIASAAGAVFGGIRDAIGGVWAAIRSAATTAWGALTSLADTAWGALRTAILTPLRDARDLAKGVWDSISRAAGDAWGALTKAIGGFAGDIRDAIGKAFEGAANQVIGFVNTIIGAINKIPGVPNIDKIELLGTDDKKVQHRAQGGKITAPMAIVGEEAPRHPEYVIPTNPAYRGRALGLTGQLMKDLGMPGFAAGGILGKVVGAVTGLVGNLPGAGDLPDWLKGTGKWVLEHVGKWIANAVKSIIPGGGGKGGSAPTGGVSGSIKGAIALAREMGLAITSTTGGNHVPGSWHYKGRAADVAGSPQQMAAFFNAALARYGSHLIELFYDPLGAIKNGARIPAIGGHSDHVHIALAKGGILPFAGSFANGGIVGGPLGAPAMAQVHGGEVISDGGALISALNEHSNELRLLRRTPHMGVIDALVDITSERTGDRAIQRGQTASRGVTALLGG